MARVDITPGLGGHEPHKNRTETEPNSRNLTLITGAGSGTGRLLARRLALEGVPVAAGIRQMSQFEGLKTITPGPDVMIRPFFADLRDSEQVEEAYRSLGLKEGQTVDFLALAAAGFQTLIDRGTQHGKEFVSALISIRRSAKDGQLTREIAEEATAAIKKAVTQSDAMKLADDTNNYAPVKLAELLVERGHINEGSTVAVLSSDMSKRTDPRLEHLDEYPGPWTYYPIGRSKAEGSLHLQDLAKQTDAHFIDFIAPDIVGTDVGKFFTDMLPLYEALHALDSKDEFVFPKVSIGHVVNVMASELSKNDSSLPQTRDVWIPGDDRAGPNMPAGWDKPPIRYL